VQATSLATASAAKAMCAGGATRRSWPAVVFQMFDGDFGNQGSFALHSDGDNKDGSMTWSVVADVARPLRAVFV
jgi:hypothetical protein